VKNRFDGFAGRGTSTFSTLDQFRQALLSSQAGSRAASVQDMVYQQDRGVGFNPNDSGRMLVLSTGPALSSVNPASLISHFDQDTYTNTTNFLMTPVVANGITLEQKWRQVGGGANQMTLAGGATERVLKFLGYESTSGSNNLFSSSNGEFFSRAFAMSASNAHETTSAAALTSTGPILATLSIALSMAMNLSN